MPDAAIGGVVIGRQTKILVFKPPKLIGRLIRKLRSSSKKR
jgi:hypothetical protein